jgi:hypothetical protein
MEFSTSIYSLKGLTYTAPHMLVTLASDLEFQFLLVTSTRAISKPRRSCHHSFLVKDLYDAALASARAKEESWIISYQLVLLCKHLWYASVRSMRSYSKVRHGSSFRKPKNEGPRHASSENTCELLELLAILLIYCNKVCIILASHMRHGLNSRNLVKCTVPLKFESISPAQIEIIASRFPWSSANHFWPGVAINDVLFTQREATG